MSHHLDSKGKLAEEITEMCMYKLAFAAQQASQNFVAKNHPSSVGQLSALAWAGLADLCWAFSLVCGQLLVGWWLVADLGWPHSYLCLADCRPKRLSSSPCILSSATCLAQAHSHGGLRFPRAARGQG